MQAEQSSTAHLSACFEAAKSERQGLEEAVAILRHLASIPQGVAACATTAARQRNPQRLQLAQFLEQPAHSRPQSKRQRTCTPALLP